MAGLQASMEPLRGESPRRRAATLGQSAARRERVLRRKLVVLEERAEHLEALVVVILLKELADLEHLGLELGVRGLVHSELGLLRLDLRLQQAEGVRVRDLHAGLRVLGQLLVGLAQLVLAVGVGAVLAEVALFVLLEVLADLRFIIIVRDVQHLELDLHRQLLRTQEGQN